MTITAIAAVVIILCLLAAFNVMGSAGEMFIIALFLQLSVGLQNFFALLISHLTEGADPN